jgi:hypothetical protein
MIFKDPPSIKAAVDAMNTAEQPRSVNRARIISLFNGNPPNTPEEARALNLSTNVNFMEPVKIAHAARGVFYQAFVDVENQLQITIPDAACGEPDQLQVWQNWITEKINGYLNDNCEYADTQREKFGQVALLGVGPVMWPTRNAWFPVSIPMSDLRIPTKTKRNMTNLDQFAVRVNYTFAQLAESIKGDKFDPGWKKDVVAKISKQEMLNHYSGIGNNQQIDITNWDAEKCVELIRENSGYWASDAVPVVMGWDFYYKNDDGKWDRRIIMDNFPQEYIYSADNYAKDLKEFVHFQYGDGNNSAPFLFHSIRGLGFMLYAVLQITNQTRCRIVESANRDMMMLWKNVGSGDRERIQSLQLSDLGIIPEGLSIVPANERYSGNPTLATGVLGQLRQLAAEHSTAFTQDIDANGSRPMTAQEVLARRNTVMTMTNAVLNQAFSLEHQADHEMVSRIFRDEKFLRDAAKDQIPKAIFTDKKWKVKRNRAIGSGDRTMQQTMAASLLAIIDRLDPEAQRLVLRIYVEAFSDVPGTGYQIVPPVQNNNTTSREKASFAWGTLMDGQKPIISGALNLKEFVDTLITMLMGKVNVLLSTDDIPSVDTLNGLAMAIAFTGEYVQQIARDPSAREIVKVAGDMLGRIEKQVVAWNAQDQQRKQESSGTEDAEVQAIQMSAQAKAMADVELANVKGRIKEKLSAQQRQHKDLAFIAAEKRKDAALENARHQKDLTLAADISRQNIEALAAPANVTAP